MKAKPIWHFWHETLLCIGAYSLAERRRVIKGWKPEDEWKTRNRRLRYVKGRLPKQVMAVLEKNFGLGDSTTRALRRLPQRDRKAIERLHRRECKSCPWDGKTLFPKTR